MDRSQRLLLVAGLLAALLPAAAATFGPQPGAPCEPTLLATQVALFCASDMPTAECCDPVVSAVDLGGGVSCLCLVAVEPQLVMAGLNATHLLTLYTSCGGLQDGARLAAACEAGPAPPAADVSSLTPTPPSPAPRRKQPAHDAPPPPPASSDKPSSPPPQEHDGAAHVKAVDPSQAATSRLAPADATAPPPQPRHSATASSQSQGTFIFVATFGQDAPPPPPASSDKPFSPPPQEHDGAAHAKAGPAPLAGPAAPAAVLRSSTMSTAPPPASATRRKQPADDATAPPPSSDAPAQSKPTELVFLVLGYVFTGVLYLSPIPSIWQIFTTNEVGLYKPDVLVVTLCSCVVGLLYGVPHPFKKAPVIFNGVGIAFQVAYLGVFFRSCSAAARWMVSICVLVMGCSVGVVAACVFLLARHPRKILGLFGDAYTVGMYAGPIRQMNTVWTTKNVDHMSIWMAGASLFSGIFRSVYAFLTRDWFNCVAYIIGAISGLVQLTLFLTVKLRYQQ